MENMNAFSEITVSAQTLMYHITRFQDRGGVLPNPSIFDAWNIDLAELEDSDERFPIKLVAIALEYAQQQLQDPVLGLNHVDPENEWFPDFLSLLAKNSTKVESFIQLYSRYFCLHSEIGTLAVIHHHPYSEIRFVPKARQVLSYHQVDGALLILKVVIERLFGLEPDSVFVDHLCPSDCEIIYQEKFASEVNFEQIHNSLLYKTEDLLKPLESDHGPLAQEYLLPANLE
ncbi:MAG: AraC family transcriptional regulator, partial [Pseudomonadales bacterium]|nr:AraC family transcriptional regulator [Pseudomonadales bacterium]